jgi:hypothetical protein
MRSTSIRRKQKMSDKRGEYFRCSECGVKYDHMPEFAKTLSEPAKGDWVAVGECRICSGDLDYLDIKEVVEQLKEIVGSDLFDHGQDDEAVSTIIDVADFEKTAAHHIVAFLFKKEFIV